MIHAVYIWIIAVALFAGYMIGAVCWIKKAEKDTPAVGYLQFNLNDPAKEFLELHITQDIDPNNPPEYVKLLVLVSEKETKRGDSK